MTKKFIICMASIVTTCLFGIPVFAENVALNVSLTNPMDTSATARGYFIAMVSGSEINLNLAPTQGDGAMQTSLDDVTVLTNAPTGYRFFASMNQKEDYDADKPGNALYREGDTSQKFIKPTAGTYENPAEISRNSWGFNIGTSETFAAMPLASAPQLLKETNVADTTPNTENTKLDIYYAAKANLDMPDGIYTGSVIYTVMADAADTESAEVVPSATTNFAGGDSVRITTSLFSIGDLGDDITVKIGDDDCAVTGTDTDDDVVSVTCTLPEKPVLVRSYDVTVSIPKYDKTYTITDGITYEYVNKLTTITTMQAMTSEICDATTTPAAFEEDGKTINANVPQSSLRDVRDNNYYTVRKLADGRCWMTENLRLEFDGETTYTSADTNLAEGTTITPAATQARTAEPTTEEIEDWKTTADGGQTTKEEIDRWMSRSTRGKRESDIRGGDRTGENQYLGVYYNWYATTAGTGGWSATGSTYTSQYSICPAGWTLPKPESQNGSFKGLIMDTYAIISSEGRQNEIEGGNTKTFSILVSKPFSFSLAGSVARTSGLDVDQGTLARYYINHIISRRAMHYFVFSVNNAIFFYENPDALNALKTNGYNVRCIAE